MTITVADPRGGSRFPGGLLREGRPLAHGLQAPGGIPAALPAAGPPFACRSIPTKPGK